MITRHCNALFEKHKKKKKNKFLFLMLKSVDMT